LAPKWQHFRPSTFLKKLTLHKGFSLFLSELQAYLMISRIANGYKIAAKMP
jgi:hypothetical protein